MRTTREMEELYEEPEEMYEPESDEASFTDAAPDAGEPDTDRVPLAGEAPVPEDCLPQGEAAAVAAAWQALMGGKPGDVLENCGRLRYLADTMGVGVPELLDALVACADKRAQEQLLERCGGNEEIAAQMAAYRKAERERQEQAHIDEAAKQAQNVREQHGQQLQQRLADDFLILSQEMPGEYASFSALPRAAVEEAIRQNISLLDACLRFRYRESKKAEQVRDRQTREAGTSTGSMSAAAEQLSPEIDAFLTGLRRSL